VLDLPRPPNAACVVIRHRALAFVGFFYAGYRLYKANLRRYNLWYLCNIKPFKVEVKAPNLAYSHNFAASLRMQVGIQSMQRDCRPLARAWTAQGQSPGIGIPNSKLGIGTEKQENRTVSKGQ
jgi:hypothetical protein